MVIFTGVVAKRNICLKVVVTTSFLIFMNSYWENLLKVIMRSNNGIFYVLFYFIANFKQVFTMF